MINFYIMNLASNYFKPIHLLILIGVLIIILIVYLIMHGIYIHRKKKLSHYIELEDNLRLLKIDLLNKTVYSLKKVNLSTPKTISLEEFLRKFDSRNQDKLNRWLLSLLNKNINSTKYLEITNYNIKSHEYYQDVFVSEKINYDNHIVHVQHLSYSIRSKKIPECPFIKNESEIDRQLYRLKKNDNITIALLSFFPTSLYNSSKDYHLDKIIYHQIIELIIQSINKNYFFSFQNNDDILLFLPNYDYEKDTFLSSLNKSIKKFYTINSLRFDNYNLCIAKMNENKSEYKNLIKKLKTFSRKLINNKVFNETMFYFDEYHQYGSDDIATLNTDIKNTIENDLISYIYKPVINSKNGFIDSYTLLIRPISEKINDYNLFVDSLLKQNLADKYLQLIIENIKKSFSDDIINNKKVAKKVNFQISPALINALINNIDLIKNSSDIDFIISFKNSSIVDAIANQSNFLDTIKLFEASNIHFGLELVDINILHEFDISIFKHISFSYTFFKDNFSHNKNKIIMKNAIMSFYKQKKFITIYEIVDWASMETLICNHVFLFSGKILDLKDEINPIVSKRLSSKVRELYSKYY